MSKFVHLHTHSHYSLLDGLAKIDDLVGRTKELGMDSLAITDHGVLYGAIEFYKKAKKAGIRPILGVEAYMAPKGRGDKEPGERYYHLILLCENLTGWKNLIKLVSIANLEGYYYKPRIDKEILRQYHEGLIGLSACLSGEVNRHLMADRFEEAKKSAFEYEEIFGKGNFFLEIGDHPNIPENVKLRGEVLKLAKATGLGLVATQDIHYAKKEDAPYHDILVAVQTGAKLTDDDRLTLSIDDFSLNSPEEMIEKFKDAPEAITNTVKIAERCNLELELGKIILPNFPKPDGKTANAYLEELLKERIGGRFPGEKLNQVVKDRLAMELGVIEKTGFADYFLIVQDFINWAKSHGIAVGPGRGSAAGSLVSYILGITDLDPIEYGLLFERFLNPDRIQMPDVDVDFADTGRDKVLAYVKEKYGTDHVAQIITFGTMAARAGIRDAGRAMGISYDHCDKLAKLIPFNMKLKEAIEKVPELGEAYEKDAEAKKLLDVAIHLEGVARHASVHACGTVISKEPLTEYLPVQLAPQDKNNIITQFEMHTVEDMGLLKIDFLGLKNLTIIEETVRLVKDRTGRDIKMTELPLDDKKTFELLRAGDTTGVFQLEGGGMRRYLKELEPSSIEDIIAMISLYRPGTLDAGMVPHYIARKLGREKVTYLHPKLEPILKKTYGIMVYQEQLMEVARALAGFTFSEADTLRKAVGKKIKALLQEQEQKLINGMIKNGIPPSQAKEIWQWFEPFARYGFNRCITGDSKIQDPETGGIYTIEEVYKNPLLLKTSYSLNEEKKISENQVSEVIQNGEKEVFEIKTRSGRKVKATLNHPLFTDAGWKKLEDIRLGEKIATPRKLSEPQRPTSVPGYKLSVLGYLLAEGNLCHPHSFYFYSKSDAEINDYLDNLERFKNTIGKVDRSKSATSVYAKRRSIKEPSEAVQWIDEIGMKYKKAANKSFPEFVFRLANKDLAILIGKMFQGDGCVNRKRKYPQIFYATSSPDIASSLQHLLLRFGILSTIHTKGFKYRGTVKIGYTVSINRYDNIEKFVCSFGQFLVGKKKTEALKILHEHSIINGTIKNWSARGSKDVVPASMVLPVLKEMAILSGLTTRGMASQFGFAPRLFFRDDRKIGFLRETVSYLGEKLKSQSLREMSSSDIYWDEIISVRSAGKEMTYDLSIQRDHNFIANDIFVHNSHAACYAMIGYQTAYLKANYSQEFHTSLLNAEVDDIDRISFLINECKKSDIEVLPPDINKSFVNFSPEEESKIRFGLVAIKNVGEQVTINIIEERARSGQFKDLVDFLNRVQHKDLNKKSLESLAKAGAFDSFGLERKQLVENIDEILKFSSIIKRSGAQTGNSLFGGSPAAVASLKLKPAEPAKLEERLSWEKELLGFYLSDHPLKSYEEKIKATQAKPISEARLIKNEDLVFRIAGLVSKIQKVMTKSGQPMMFVKVEDLSPNPMEVIVFNKTLMKTQMVWEENKVVLVQGKISLRGGEAKMICDQARILEV